MTSVKDHSWLSVFCGPPVLARIGDLVTVPYNKLIVISLLPDPSLVEVTYAWNISMGMDVRAKAQPNLLCLPPRRW